MSCLMGQMAVVTRGKTTPAKRWDRNRRQSNNTVAALLLHRATLLRNRRYDGVRREVEVRRRLWTVRCASVLSYYERCSGGEFIVGGSPRRLGGSAVLRRWLRSSDSDATAPRPVFRSLVRTLSASVAGLREACGEVQRRSRTGRDRHRQGFTLNLLKKVKK